MRWLRILTPESNSDRKRFRGVREDGFLFVAATREELDSYLSSEMGIRLANVDVFRNSPGWKEE